jgi:hypothetical protein
MLFATLIVIIPLTVLIREEISERKEKQKNKERKKKLKKMLFKNLNFKDPIVKEMKRIFDTSSYYNHYSSKEDIVIIELLKLRLVYQYIEQTFGQNSFEYQDFIETLNQDKGWNIDFLNHFVRNGENTLLSKNLKNYYSSGFKATPKLDSKMKNELISHIKSITKSLDFNKK